MEEKQCYLPKRINFVLAFPLSSKWIVIVGFLIIIYNTQKMAHWKSKRMPIFGATGDSNDSGNNGRQ